MSDAATTIPQRSQISAADQWDLSKLFPAEDAWERGIEQYEDLLPRIATFKGTLGQSAAALRACLEFLRICCRDRHLQGHAGSVGGGAARLPGVPE